MGTKGAAQTVATEARVQENDPNAPYHMRGEFVEVSPPHRVVFTWGFEDSTVGVPPGSSTVEVTLEPDGDGTRLRLVHRDLPDASRADHDAGWDGMLERLAAVVGAVRSPSAAARRA